MLNSLMKQDTEENCDRLEMYHEVGVPDFRQHNRSRCDEVLGVGKGYCTFSWA
jgi:hypothetical protein